MKEVYKLTVGPISFEWFLPFATWVSSMKAVGLFIYVGCVWTIWLDLFSIKSILKEQNNSKNCRVKKCKNSIPTKTFNNSNRQAQTKFWKWQFDINFLANNNHMLYCMFHPHVPHRIFNQIRPAKWMPFFVKSYMFFALHKNYHSVLSDTSEFLDIPYNYFGKGCTNKQVCKPTFSISSSSNKAFSCCCLFSSWW